jgi:outer membrane immunogenic protein
MGETGMRNLLAIVAVATLGAGVCQTALAADLPVKAPPPAAVAPVTTWTGCYIGGNAGAAWGSGDVTVAGVGFIESRGGGSNAAFAGGGQVGCDFQTGAFVFGVRDSFDWSNRDRSRVLAVGALAGSTVTLRNDWIDLLTGRVGYAVAPQWLLYIQGGGAWRQSSLDFITPGGVAFGSDRNRSGWVIGGGAEWRLGTNWSVFLEYNHADFGTRSATFLAAAPIGPVTVSGKSDADLFLVGLNWRPNFFGGGGY